MKLVSAFSQLIKINPPKIETSWVYVNPVNSYASNIYFYPYCAMLNDEAV